MQILFFIFIAILLIIIYFLSSDEDKKTGAKNEHSGKLEEYWAEKERRRCQRFETMLNVSYKLLKSSEDHSAASSKNISEVGICVLTYEMLPINSPIEIKIALPDTRELIDVKGKVVWREESEKEDKDGKRSFLIGVEFVDFDQKHKDKLMSYMNAYCPAHK
ncbi:MAG: PilZ domain-containing protein [Candidatus Omnitrophota bacterium]